MRPDFDPTTAATINRPMNKGSSFNDDTSRLDATAKVTGRAKYSKDMYLPNAIFVALVRCPYGAGELESFDKDAALKVPGVLDVDITGKEGKYQGQNVGYLAAETPHAMKRGMRALKAKWTKSPVKTTIGETIKEIPEVSQETKDLLAKADHVLEATYSTQVQIHACLETHGSVVDHQGDSATVYSSTQGTSAAKDGLEQTIGLPKSKYEVVCEYVGGGFGSKLNGAGKEGLTAAKVAAKYKRPTYLFVNRAEDQVDTGNRPSTHAVVKVGFAKDGKVLGGEIRTWGGVGVSRGGGNISLPSGRYKLGDIKRPHTEVSLNAGGPRPFRAPGSPPGAFIEELMLDEIATIAGVDPLQLRLKLERDEDRRDMLTLGAKLIGWSNRKATGSQKGAMRRGFGMGTASWHRGSFPTAAEVAIHRDGSVEARTGTQDIGTGQRTIMGVMAAEGLHVPLRLVSVNIGSSDLPGGPGSGGSMTATNSAPAMTSAGADARKKLLAAVAAREEVDVASLSIEAGAILKDKKPFMTWTEACSKLPSDTIVGQGDWSQQEARADTTTGHSHGAQFAEVEVDTETGVIRVKRVIAIQSGGRIISRKTAESQVIGAVIQGLSYALFEARVLDRNVGSMMNANLEMYKILGPNDMPHIEPILWTKGQTGVRPIGEPPTIPTAGAVACAVFNAIGKPVRHLPMTPDKVLTALEGAGA